MFILQNADIKTDNLREREREREREKQKKCLDVKSPQKLCKFDYVEGLEQSANLGRIGNPCCEFAEVEIPRKFSHVGNCQWKHQILSLSQCREQAEKQGSKRKNSTILDTSEVSTYTTTYLLTYQQELPICFPPPSSDLKTATSKGILQIRRQDRVAAADSPRRKKCGKNGLKFGESLVPERGPFHSLRC